MIIGGAQENTLFNCLDLQRIHGDQVVLFTGPTTGPEGKLLAQGRAAGLTVVELSALRRTIVPWHDIRAYRQLKHALRTYDPEVVHTHSAKGGWLGRRAAWKLGVPAILHTVHGAPFHEYQSAAARELFRKCEQIAARWCHQLISVADAMTDQLVAAGVAPRDKFRTIYSGMDVEPFLSAGQNRQAIRAALGFHDDEIVVGKVARLFHLKGHDDLIDAAARLRSQYPQVKYLLVGDGTLRQQLETRIASLGMADCFRFVGLVPPERVPEYLGAMDLLVHCSLREGLARALPQALISGIPAVSFDIDGAREVVIDRVTGRLLPPRDIAGLAAAIGELALRADLRAAWGAEGRRRFTDVFRHQTMTARIRELYLQLLARPATH
jgi:glycosyltransferase involved in cell wall biosynthesis